MPTSVNDIMTDKIIEISLLIAGIPLKIPVHLQEEKLYRDAADGINQMWDEWRHRFPTRPSHEIMAMVTLLFAKGYMAAHSFNIEASKALEEAEKTIDSLLLDRNPEEKPM